VVPVTNSASSWNWQAGEFKSDTGKVPNAGPQVTITATNRQGLLLTKPQLCATFGDQDLTPWQALVPPEDRLVVNGITGCYNLATQEASLAGILELGEGVGGPGVGADRFSASFTLKNWQLENVSAQLDRLQIEVGPGIFFQRMGLSASWNVSSPTPIPSAIELNGGISFGPDIDGAELASMDASGTLALSDPLMFAFKGNILLGRRTIFQSTIAGGFVNWWPATGQFDFGGHLTLLLVDPIGITGPLDADVSGFMDTTGNFQLSGTGTVAVLFGPTAKISLLINNRVIAACENVTGAGFVRYMGGTTDWFPAGVCNLGAYTIPEPPAGVFPHSTYTVREARAATSSRRILIPPGLSTTTFKVTGTTTAPLIQLRGPRGTMITTPVSGAVNRGSVFLIRDPRARTTYVAIGHPLAGTWTIRALPHSVPIVSVLEAKPAPEPKLSVKAKLAGCSERVTYDYRSAAGERELLLAQNGTQRTVLGYARRGRHTLRFVPSLTGKGEISALQSYGDIPQSQHALLTFSATPYRRAATARNLVLRRSTLSWTPACHAGTYSVTLTNNQGTTTATTSTNHLAVGSIGTPFTATITAFAAQGGGTTSAHADLH